MPPMPSQRTARIASVGKESLVLRIRQTQGILLVVAGSDVLRVGRQIAHRKRSIITCLPIALYV